MTNIEDEYYRVKEVLRVYSRELKLNSDLMVEDLIISHRDIRKKIIEMNVNRLNIMRLAAEQASEDAVKNGYLSINQLRAMSLGEVADFIATDSTAG